ncbi:MAG: hypothetical protein H0T90_06945 [Gemmatimonadales bacterium]|nr:hypothetical protein [Gemmatimonadales bacterium]
MKALHGALAALLLGCNRTDAVPRAEREPDDAPARPDSLVATAPGGAEVWLTLARVVQAGDGSECVDRAMEIREGATRIPVPLLYTGSPVELLGDTALRARLSVDCKPGDTYVVNLQTGRPVRER